MVLHIGIHTSYKSESSYFCLVILISMRYSHNINNNNNNRFIISTIGPTWHSLLVTTGFLRLLSASYALCSITFAYLELQKLYFACHSFSQHDIFHAVLSPYHECFFALATTYWNYQVLNWSLQILRAIGWFTFVSFFRLEDKINPKNLIMLQSSAKLKYERFKQMFFKCLQEFKMA